MVSTSLNHQVAAWAESKDTVVSSSLNHPHRCLSGVEGKEAEKFQEQVIDQYL